MQAKLDFSAVKTLLAIDNPIIRKGVWNLLQQEGFRDFTMVSSYVQVQETISKVEFDLIVMVTEMGTLSISQSMHELRFGKFTSHPFPVSIMFAVSSEQQDLMKQINYGPDSLLIIPVVPNDFLTRLRSLSHARKPFVVTFNYIGPDRRKQVREDGTSAPLFEVPNPLKARAGGQSHESLRRDIVAAQVTLNRMKVKGDAVQIRWLSDAIRKARADGAQADITEHMNNFAMAAADIRLRTKDWVNTKFEALVTGITETLAETGGGEAKIERLFDLGAQTIREIERCLT